MNFEELKTQIAQIVAICKDVPEEFRSRCFEMLLAAVLKPRKTKAPDEPTDRVDDELDDRDEPGEQSTLTAVPGVVKAFLRKTELPDSVISKLVMLDGEELHFLKEPSHTNSRRGQNEWALLLALKNALLGKAFTVDPEAVRSTVQDKGFYDKSNFAGNFKKEPYVRYYKGPMEAQGAAQALSKEGEAALAELIKTLTP